MKRHFERLKAWYLRRFRGYVAAPVVAGSRGTAWQEHQRKQVIPGITPGTFWFNCRCGRRVTFAPADLYIREQDPETQEVLSARYCKVCQKCGLGHWMPGEKAVTRDS